MALGGINTAELHMRFLFQTKSPGSEARLTHAVAYKSSIDVPMIQRDSSTITRRLRYNNCCDVATSRGWCFIYLLIQGQPKVRQARHSLLTLAPENNLARGNRTAKSRGSALELPLKRERLSQALRG